MKKSAPQKLDKKTFGAQCAGRDDIVRGARFVNLHRKALPPL